MLVRPIIVQSYFGDDAPVMVIKRGYGRDKKRVFRGDQGQLVYQHAYR